MYLFETKNLSYEAKYSTNFVNPYRVRFWGAICHKFGVFASQVSFKDYTNNAHSSDFSLPSMSWCLRSHINWMNMPLSSTIGKGTRRDLNQNCLIIIFQYFWYSLQRLLVSASKGLNTFWPPGDIKHRKEVILVT